MKWTCPRIPNRCLLGAPPSEGRPENLNNFVVDAALIRNPVLGYRQTAQCISFPVSSTFGFADPKGNSVKWVRDDEEPKYGKKK